MSEKEFDLLKDHYRIIFENSTVSITLVDDQEKIVSWNKYTEDLLGMTKEDLQGLPVESLYPKEEWEQIRSSNIREKGGYNQLETRMIKKNGDVFDVEISISVLKDDDGKVKGSIGFVQDITKRKQGERDIQEAHRLRDDFLSMVSHELKTPISAVQGSLNIILDEAVGEVNEEQKDFLNTAMRNIDRLDCLVSDVLEYQKLEMGKTTFDFSSNNLNEMVQQIRDHMMADVERKGLTFDLKLDNNLPKINFDYDKIIKVLSNLVENAVKFTKKGGVTIETAKHDDDHVRISVIDTGMGVKEENLKRLFKIFGQLSTGDKRMPGSTGLGLVIAKIIIQKHKGEIWAESEYEQGTKFSFTLPFST